MKPTREHATNNAQTYFVSSDTWERCPRFRAEPWARLLIETFYVYRGSAYLLHEFVVMPDHFHVLISPVASLERSVQFIKGGFSRRLTTELQCHGEVWQRGFSDHRIRDAADYDLHRNYIWQNLVKAHLCLRAEDYPYSSRHAGFSVDPIPQRLKPQFKVAAVGTAEAVPFQSGSSTTFSNRALDGENDG